MNVPDVNIASEDPGPRPSGIPTPAGVLIVVLYLVSFRYWSQIVYGPYSFIIQRICFVAIAIPCLLVILRIPLREVIGVFDVPGRACPTLFVGSLALLIATRLTVKMLFQHWLPGTDMLHLDIDHFFQECVLPPLNEELVFRGLIIMSLWVPFRGNKGWMIVISAMIFSSVHPARILEQQVATSLMGLILGHFFVKTRSLSSCMVLHAVSNSGVFMKLPVFSL